MLSGSQVGRARARDLRTTQSRPGVLYSVPVESISPADMRDTEQYCFFATATAKGHPRPDTINPPIKGESRYQAPDFYEA
jgi:hypothetical protein